MRVYWQQENNFGDKLTPYLIRKLFGIDVIFSKHPNKLLGVGSILSHAMEGDTIWGSGLISPRHLPYSKNINVIALRGPNTEIELKAWGVKIENCVYGDPALLLPIVYTPQVEKRYKVGIIPHYVDYEMATEKARERKDNYHIINVMLPIEQFIDEVNECEYIESSCLHGLITADAYGIPRERVKYTDKLIGGDFKFDDYEEGKRLFRPDQLINRLNYYIAQHEANSSH